MKKPRLRIRRGFDFSRSRFETCYGAGFASAGCQMPMWRVSGIGAVYSKGRNRKGLESRRH